MDSLDDIKPSDLMFSELDFFGNSSSCTLLDDSFLNNQLLGGDPLTDISDLLNSNHTTDLGCNVPTERPTSTVLESLLKNPSNGPVVTPAPATQMHTNPVVINSNGNTTDQLINLLLKQRQDEIHRENLISSLSQIIAAHSGASVDPQLYETLKQLPTLQLEEMVAMTNKNKQDITQDQSNVLSVVSDDSRRGSDDVDLMTAGQMDLDESDSGSCQRPKLPRKSSHNVIEKRYRLSINDRIDELRIMLVGKDGKLNKSSVLRKAIERIRNLQRENERLKDEVFRLRSQQLDFKREKKSSWSQESPVGSVEDCSSSDSPRSMPSPDCRGSSDNGRSKLIQLLETNKPMGLNHDTARMTIGLMAFCFFFFFNPFQFAANGLMALGTDQFQEHSSASRTLKSVSDHLNNSIWSNWCFSIVNWIVLAAVCYKFLLPKTLMYHYGEKSYGLRLDAYRRCVSSAEDELIKGSYNTACSKFQTALLVLDRPLPKTNVQWFCQLLWHLLLAIGLRFFPLPIIRSDRKQAALSVALVYGRLSEMVLTSVVQLAPWKLFVLVLNGWNFADLSDNDGQVEQRVNMWICLGLSCRRCLPRHLHFVARYFYNRALDELMEQQNVDKSLKWLLTEQGQAYLCEYVPGPQCRTHRMDDTIYSSHGKSWSAIDSVRSDFIESLQEMALEALLTGDEDKLLSIGELLQLVMDVCLEREPIDRVGQWWSSQCQRALKWRLSDGSTEEDNNDIAMVLPSLLSNDRLANCVQESGKVYWRAVLGSKGAKDMCEMAAWKTADESSILFRNLLDEDSAVDSKHSLRWMTKAWCLVGIDWLLSARASLFPTSGCGTKELAKFQSELDMLRLLSRKLQVPERRWLLPHEAAFRLLANGNPLATRGLLRQAGGEKARKKMLLARMVLNGRGLA